MGHDTCSNHVPIHRQTKHDKQKHHKFAPTAGARSLISPKLCMVIEDVMTILKHVNHFSNQCTVFPTGAKMLIFGDYALSMSCHGNRPVTRNSSIADKPCHA